MNLEFDLTQKLKANYQAGEVIAGKYRLAYPAAAGGMGAVWAARNVSLDAPVAIKLIHQHHTQDEESRRCLVERLWREAHATAKVPHAAIVKVLDFGFTERDDPYLAMELLEGESLGALLDREFRLAPERALAIMLPIAEGLCAAHAAGIVHRDLKPDNIFLAKQSDGRIQPKLVDFGIAKLTWMEGNGKMTGTAMIGTPDYMAPEQIYATEEIDERSDVWAFSVVLYEMLSGRTPFSVKSLPDVYCAICTRPALPLAQSMDLDGDLWAIVERGLAKDPRARWQSIRELGDKLAAWLVARGIDEDVTGALLCTRWSVARSWTPVPPPPPAVDTVDVSVQWSDDDAPRRAFESDAPQIVPAPGGVSEPPPVKRSVVRRVARGAVRAVAGLACSVALLAWMVRDRSPLVAHRLAEMKQSAVPAILTAQDLLHQVILEGEAAGQSFPKSIDDILGHVDGGTVDSATPSAADAGSDGW